MTKEWILNPAMNRWQLNYKRNVGPTSEEIRKCAPKSVEEWQEYYYKNVYPEEHLIQLGKTLYVKVTEVLTSEIESITEEDCIQYIKNMVINRTYDGYIREIKTIYGQLEELLGVKIEPASDKWDRLYNVDFYIKVNSSYIGIQIKPINNALQLPQIYKEHKLQKESHERFYKEFGGKVFYIFSTKEGESKNIANREVIDEISSEIRRLSSQK